MASKAHSLRALAAITLLIPFAAPPARAAENYVIPSSDGYGIGECMHAGMDCGRVVADSWCESHGHAHVLAYGTVEDVTGAIQASNKSEALHGNPGDIVIRCGD